MSSMRHRAGFTLVELMIALAIFSVAALTVLKHTSLSVRQHSQVVEKTLAVWLAENAIAELRLSNPWPTTGSSSETVRSAQREWQITTRIADTSVKTLRKVVVTVQREDKDTALATLTGYLGEH